MELPVQVWGTGTGWLLAELGSVHVSYADHRVSDKEAQLAYLECQARAIDETVSRGTCRCVLNFAPSPAGMDPVARKRFARMLEERRAELEAITRLFVLVTPSTLTRGIVTAVLWLAPPPYPHTVCGDIDDGFRAVERADEQISAQQYAQAYRDLVRTHVPGVELAA